MNKSDTNIRFQDKDNPFTKECKDCIKNIWEKLSAQQNNTITKCSNKTYINIEKLKDRN